MLKWVHFPRWRKPPNFIEDVVAVFGEVELSISSASKELGSDAVLSHVRPGLGKLGFRVEAGKKKSELVRVPVLFGEFGKPDKAFHADAHHGGLGVVVEVEAGRAYTNNQFLKDLFQACVMSDVRELVIAVRQKYREQPDYELISVFLETLFASARLKLPLEGLTLIGY